MTAPPTIQTNPLDPVFSGVPVVIPQSGTVNPTWNKWFVDLREKVNVINQTLATLSDGSVDPSTGALAISSGGTGATTVAGAQANLGILGNPMTASGDIIIGGTGGTPTRLPKGTNGYVLTLVSGVPAWAAGGGGGGGFNPLTPFSGATRGVWFDFTDLTTLFQDTAGTIPVTTVGQSIARVNDKSGLGFNGTQATTAKQPTLTQDADGVYGALFTSGCYFSLGQAINAQPLLMACCVGNSNSALNRIIDNRGTGGTGTVRGVFLSANGTGSYVCFCDDGSGHYVGYGNTSLTGKLVNGFYYHAGNLITRVAGVVQQSYTASMGTIVNTNNNTVGIAIDGTTQPFTGTLYQVYAVGGVQLSTATMLDVTNYLYTACHA